MASVSEAYREDPTGKDWARTKARQRSSVPQRLLAVSLCLLTLSYSIDFFINPLSKCFFSPTLHWHWGCSFFPPTTSWFSCSTLWSDLIRWRPYINSLCGVVSSLLYLFSPYENKPWTCRKFISIGKKMQENKNICSLLFCSGRVLWHPKMSDCKPRLHKEDKMWGAYLIWCWKVQMCQK